MTTAATPDLVHRLVTGSHAEGITTLAVQAVVTKDTSFLLLAQDGADFGDDLWLLPGGLVLPGQTLTDALDPVAAAIGLSIDEVTGYLGHDDDGGDQIVRTFRFAVTVTDPDSICRSGSVGHRWVDIDVLADPMIGGTDPHADEAGGKEPPIKESTLAESLRVSARGVYPDEAAVALLIDHGAFLRRSDFTSRFVYAEPAPGDHASIDWLAAIVALDAGDLPCSGGEARALRFAASLGDGSSVDLRDATGVDRRTAHLFSRAVLHANGIRPTDFM
jgi:hypothetical protein